MASSYLATETNGLCCTDIDLNNNHYKSVNLKVMKNLCCDVILGQDFQRQHKSVQIMYGGPKPDLVIRGEELHCALAAASLESPSLFGNLNPKCKPIATKSRKFGKDDREFIEHEINSLLKESIIESSSSPWRAQVVVVKDSTERHRKRLCVDYSQTINLFTELDAYPLPRIDEMINNLANYKLFSTYDLKSAYHQILLRKDERKFTAFEANGKLYQYCRVPFGVTNGVAIFQREMDKLVHQENLKDTFPYLDNITVAGRDKTEHDQNVKKFLDTIKTYNLTLNHSKSIESVPAINILGYWVGNGIIKPDPERLQPLQEIPIPTTIESLRRALGMFAYYAKWIPNFSDKIQQNNFLWRTKLFLHFNH